MVEKRSLYPVIGSRWWRVFFDLWYVDFVCLSRSLTIVSREEAHKPMFISATAFQSHLAFFGGNRIQYADEMVFTERAHQD